MQKRPSRSSDTPGRVGRREGGRHLLRRRTCGRTRDQSSGIATWAFRISPVRGSTRRRADRETRVGGHEPAHRRVARIEGVDRALLVLLLDDDRVLEADLLERLVPFEDAVAHRGTVLFGDVAVDPEDDRLLRLGQRRGRVLLLEPPAIDVVRLGGELRVGGKIPHLRSRNARRADRRAARPSARAASRSCRCSRETGCARRAGS